MAILYVDGTNGDDDTGTGSAGNPFQSIGVATGSAASGDTIVGLAGTTVEGAIRLPDGVTLAGQGQTQTQITSTQIITSLGAILSAGNDCLIRDVWVKLGGGLAVLQAPVGFVTNATAPQALSNNVTINDSTFEGESDGAYFQGTSNTTASWTFNRCTFTGNFDNVAMFKVSTGLPNFTAIFNDSVFNAHGPFPGEGGTHLCRAIQCSTGRAVLNRCTMDARGGSNGNYTIFCGANGIVNLNNCVITGSDTHINVSAGGMVLVNNTIFDPTKLTISSGGLILLIGILRSRDLAGRMRRRSPGLPFCVQ